MSKFLYYLGEGKKFLIMTHDSVFRSNKRKMDNFEKLKISFVKQKQ